MANFKKKITKEETKTDALVKEIEDDASKFEPTQLKPVNFKKVVSTGSTLLDLAISGERSRYGGIPGGVLVEVYGVSSGGKTSILSEILASALSNGGLINVLDPEGRLDAEYARCYGLQWNPEDYDRPDTIMQTFDLTKKFISNHVRENETDPINAVGTDSIAALSTELEMEQGDKMGMKRAKDLSTSMRLICREIANSGNLVVCTNQIRMGDQGRLITPGGFALEFYSSLRLHVKKTPFDIIKKIQLRKKTEEDKKEEEENKKGKRQKKKKEEKTTIDRVVGVRSDVYISKSTVGIPYRTAPICIRFNYGLDDIMANIQYMKDMTLDTMFETPDGARFQGLEMAIAHVEEHNLEKQLKEQVIDLWHSLEDQVKVNRKPKVR